MKPSAEIALQQSSFGFLELGAENGHAIRGVGQRFAPVAQPARKIVMEALQEYRKGNKAPLGKLIGRGVDRAVNHMNYTPSDGAITKDMDVYSSFTDAAVKLAQRDPELCAIAEKNGMTKETVDRMAGLQRFSAVSRLAKAAKSKLTDENLPLRPEERKACLIAILRCRMLEVHLMRECKERSELQADQYDFEQKRDDLQDRINKEPDERSANGCS